MKKVVTACPHCLHTLKHEYPQFGGNFEVIHHTQLIRELVARQDRDAAARAASGNGAGRRSASPIHDSCYLGRWNGEYDAPRDVLDALPSAPPAVVELPRNKRARLLLRRRRRPHVDGGEDRHAREPQPHRRDPRDRRRDGRHVACPFCTIMLADGVKDRNAGERVAGPRRRRAGRQVDEAEARDRRRARDRARARNAARADVAAGLRVGQALTGAVRRLRFVRRCSARRRVRVAGAVVPALAIRLADGDRRPGGGRAGRRGCRQARIQHHPRRRRRQRHRHRGSDS